MLGGTEPESPTAGRWSSITVEWLEEQLTPAHKQILGSETFHKAERPPKAERRAKRAARSEERSEKVAAGRRIKRMAAVITLMQVNLAAIIGMRVKVDNFNVVDEK